jgi:hypothetical protein
MAQSLMKALRKHHRIILAVLVAILIILIIVGFAISPKLALYRN